MNEFINNSSIPTALVRAVIRQSGGWDSFRKIARDVAQYGANSGFPGWTYCRDTVSFAGRNRKPIMDYAKSMASDLGEPSAYAMIAGFRCLNMAPDQVAEAIWRKGSEDREQVLNALAWFALEDVARAYDDLARE